MANSEAQPERAVTCAASLTIRPGSLRTRGDWFQDPPPAVTNTPGCSRPSYKGCPMCINLHASLTPYNPYCTVHAA